MDPKIPVDRNKIQAFGEKWKVKELYLFGSVLREDFRPDSDVDVLIKFTSLEGIGLDEWFGMIEVLEAVFGRKVDLVSATGVKNPFLRQEIAQTRRLIYAA
ncbi:MAG: nucleotidyltransferase family protein [bacterium]